LEDVVSEEIFRKSSLDRLSSPDQLDQLLTVSAPRLWLALLAVVALLSAGVVWGFTGSVSYRVAGQGVLVRSRGILSVAATGTGRLVELRVKPDDRVQVNQVIGIVSQPELTQRIRHAEEQVASARTEREEVIAARLQGFAMRIELLKRHRDDLSRDIENSKQEERLAAEQIPVDEHLEAGGVLSKQAVISDRQKLAALQSQTARLQTQLSSIASEQQTLETQMSDSKREMTDRVRDLEQSRRLLELDYAETSKVLSPYSGRVLEVKANEGALVTAGAPVISIEPEDKTLEILAYLPSSQVKTVRRGMAAEVSPASVKREEFGFIPGHVIWVADFPTTPEAVMKTLQNEALVKTLAATPVTEVRIRLETDTKTKSGFHWSSSRGPSSRVDTGTLVSIQIVTFKRRPASLVLPIFKDALGAS
jgi:HlyD family secretion protein